MSDLSFGSPDPGFDPLDLLGSSGVISQPPGGATAPLAPTGALGTAQTPAAPQPTSQPAPTASPAGRESPFQTIADERGPLAAVFALLGEVGASLQGKELPSKRIRENALERQALQLKGMQVGLSAMEQAARIAKGAAPKDRGAIYRNTLAKFKEIGILDQATIDVSAKIFDLDPAKAEAAAKLFNDPENLKVIQGICGGDAACMVKQAQNNEFMAFLRKNTDRRNTPSILAKAQVIQDVLKSVPGGNAVMQKLAKDGFTVAEMQQIPKEFGYSKSELETIRRNKEVQAQLIPLGLTLPSAQAAAQKTALMGRAKAEFKEAKTPQTENYLIPGRSGEKDRVVTIDKTAPDFTRKLADIQEQGGFKVSTSIQATKAGDLPGIGKPEAKEFRNMQAGTLDVLSSVDRLIGQLDKGGGGVLTITGGASRLATGFAAQIESFAKSFGGTAIIDGKEVSESALRDPKIYQFPKVQGQAQLSARVRGNFIDLAYSMARAKDPGGRLSDRDVQVQLDSIGADLGDPKVVKAALQESAVRAVTALENRALVLGQSLGAEVQKRLDAFKQSAGRVRGQTDTGLPEGIPAGSKLIGRLKDGAPVYQTPSGSRLKVTK